MNKFRYLVSVFDIDYHPRLELTCVKQALFRSPLAVSAMDVDRFPAVAYYRPNDVDVMFDVFVFRIREKENSVEELKKVLGKVKRTRFGRYILKAVRERNEMLKERKRLRDAEEDEIEEIEDWKERKAREEKMKADKKRRSKRKAKKVKTIVQMLANLRIGR